MVTEDHGSVLLPPNSPLPFLISTSFLLTFRRPASSRRQWAQISAFRGSSLLWYRYIPKEVRKVSPRPSFAFAPLGQSVNAGIPSDEFSLHCVPVDNAISFICQHRPGAYFAKVWHQECVPQLPGSLEGLASPQHRVGRQKTTSSGFFGFRLSPFIFNTKAGSGQRLDTIRWEARRRKQSFRLQHQPSYPVAILWVVCGTWRPSTTAQRSREGRGRGEGGGGRVLLDLVWPSNAILFPDDRHWLPNRAKRVSGGWMNVASVWTLTSEMVLFGSKSLIFIRASSQA